MSEFRFTNRVPTLRELSLGARAARGEVDALVDLWVSRLVDPGQAAALLGAPVTEIEAISKSFLESYAQAAVLANLECIVNGALQLHNNDDA